MFKWLFKKDDDFRTAFSSTKKIRIDGVPFTIRKINVLDYLEGAKVMAESFSVYKMGNDKAAAMEAALDPAKIAKLKKYLTDIICAGCVEPKFVRQEAGNANEVSIDELFTDWVLAQKLATAIFEHTHGKKK